LVTGYGEDEPVSSAVDLVLRKPLDLDRLRQGIVDAFERE
jgi:hypothetical protein